MDESDILVQSILNARRSGATSFEVLKPAAYFNIMGMTGEHKDKGFLIPDHVHGPYYYWWLAVFVEIDFYPNQRVNNPYAEKPFEYLNHLGVHFLQLGDGTSIVDLSMQRFNEIEAAVEKMNEQGYLSLFDLPEYDGPLLIQGCRLVARPEFMKNVLKGLGGK